MPPADAGHERALPAGRPAGNVHRAPTDLDDPNPEHRLHLAIPLLALMLASLPLAAQRFEPSFQLGFRAPISGDLVVPVPTPGGVGFTSTPRTFTETGGLVVGVGGRVRLNDTFGLATGLSATLAERTTEWNGNTNCRPCSNTIVNGLLGISARRALNARYTLDAMLGGEAVHLTGDAQELDVGTTGRVVPARKTVGGLTASVGTTLAPVSSGLLRLDLQLRAYSVRSEWTEASLTQIYGDPATSSVRDVRLTLGWSF